MNFVNRTAVLFLVFNRPSHAKAVVAEIAKARPPRLYIAGDGPRLAKGIDEIALVEKTRQEVLAAVDWDCQVKTLFRSRNLGCRQAVSSSIGWFFSQESEGIILEDDCLPSPYFFRFCQELLELYRHNKKVMALTGFNDQNGSHRGNYGYYFSQIAPTWGWATWGDRWDKYNQAVEVANKILAASPSPRFTNSWLVDAYWRDIFRATMRGDIDSWGYLWAFTILYNQGLVAVSNENMIVNIGFDNNTATHTSCEVPAHYSEWSGAVSFPLVENPCLSTNTVADDFSYRHSFQFRGVSHLLLRKLVMKAKSLRKAIGG